MKKTIIVFILFTALIIGAGFGYDYLANRYNNAAGSQNSETADNSGGVTQNGNLSPASDFTMIDTDGNKVKLSSLYGKPIVMNFWATWCKYCVDELPDFQDVYDKYGDEVQFVMVNLTDGKHETVSSASDFIKKSGFTFPVYFDSYQQAKEAYNVYSIPCTYIIDSSGNIIAQHPGLISKADLIKLLGY